MNVLVLGAEGLLGSCLMRSLAQTPWQVTGFGKSSLDITDQARVELELGKGKPDVIINASAYTAVDAAESDVQAADAVNNLAVRNLARVAQRLNAVLIHFSTDYVFNGEQSQPYSEIDLPQPLNIYGKTKLAGELAIIEEATKYFIIRTSWLFGDSGNNFFNKMLDLLQSSSELNIVSDQVGGPTYVNDLVAVVDVLLARCGKRDPVPWGVYHYAGYPFVSWCEFASFIQSTLSIEHRCLLRPLASAAYPSRVIRPLNSRLDSSLVERLLQIGPSAWQAAVRHIVAQRGI